MWGPILAGFTILGAFLALAAWINGRAIRKYIGELTEKESGVTRELIAGESQATRELIEKLVLKLSEQHETMIKIIARAEG